MNRGHLIAIVATTLGGGIAYAQGAVPGLRGHDSDAPVDVDAGRTEVQFRNDRAVFSGGVRVTQGRLQMDSARIRVAYTTAGGTEIQRIDASGGVIFRSPTETARGDSAIYDLNRRIITMLGNVSLARGASDSLKGNRLVINLVNGLASIDGSTVAGAGATSSGGRVTGRFTPPKRTN